MKTGMWMVGVIALLASVPVQAQQKLDALLVYGKDFIFSVQEPNAWVVDTEHAADYQANALIYPKSQAWQDGSGLIRISVIDKTDERVEKDVAADMSSYRARYPRVQFKNIAISHPTYRVYPKVFFVPNSFYEYVAYVNPGPQSTVMFSVAMNKQKTEATKGELATFRNVIASLQLLKAPRPDAPLYVGVLENINSDDKSTITTSQEHVRIAFQKRGASWVAMKSDFDTPKALTRASRFYPATVHWTGVLHGKRIGVLTSKNPGPPDWYADVGAQIITTPVDRDLQVSLGSSMFSYAAGAAKTRPLLLVSAPNVRDPDNWRPTTLSAAEKRIAIANFRKRVPALEQCDKPEEQPIHMVPYADNEILFLKAYRSKNGEVLFGQQLDATRSKCGFFDDDYFADDWFVLHRNGVIRLLGSQMTPLDAADLDNSGHSEWVFQTSRGEDEDGYELFYDDFNKKAYFHWLYH